MMRSSLARLVRVGMLAGALGALAVPAGRLAAQSDAVPRVWPGQTVRVRMRGGDRVTMTLGAVSGDSLTRTFMLASSFPPADVDSLWVRGHASKIGAIAGGLASGAYAVAAFASSCGGAFKVGGCDQTGTIILFSASFAAGGALLGAGIGALARTWDLRYARDRRAAITPILAPGRVGLAVRF